MVDKRTMLHGESPHQACDRAGYPTAARQRTYRYRVGPDLVPRYYGFRWRKALVKCAQRSG